MNAVTSSERSGVDHRDLPPIPYELTHLIEGNIGAPFRIVDPPVGVFFENNFFGHHRLRQAEFAAWHNKLKL